MTSTLSIGATIALVGGVALVVSDDQDAQPEVELPRAVVLKGPS